MKEQFVTYEIAFKLKELGFDGDTWLYIYQKIILKLNMAY